MRKIEIDLETLAEDCQECGLPSLPCEVRIGGDPLETWPGTSLRVTWACACGTTWSISKLIGYFGGDKRRMSEDEPGIRTGAG